MSTEMLGFGGGWALRSGGSAALGALLLALATSCSGRGDRPDPSSAGLKQPLDGAAGITERQVLVVDDVDHFGQAMGISGNSVIVGANGAAYVLTQTGHRWQQEQKLSESDSGYGKKVALAGNTAAVAADGVVYVYVRTADGWSEQERLAVPGVDFGSSVALSGNTLIVGAPYGQAQDVDGVAYVYARSGSSWTEQGLLSPNWDYGGGCFGCAVAIEGDTAVVGMPLFGPSDMGTAWVFERNDGEWSLVQGLGNGTTGGNLGAALSIVDGVIYVGSPGHMAPQREEPLVGAVFVFVPNDEGGWEERRVNAWLPLIFPSDARHGMRFGEALAVSTDTLLVGAPGADTAYVYTHESFEYTEAKKLSAAGGGFGSALVFTPSMVLVGAPEDGAGSVTAFGQPQPLAEDGAACSADDECASEHCVEGVCCATACSDEGAASCGQTGACDATGHCALYPQGTVCSQPMCQSDQVALGAATCDGAGSCGSALEQSCGAGHVCEEGACLKTCHATLECGSGVCGDDGTCLLPDAAACSADAECEGGHCADGYCCNSACTGNCESCAAPGSEGRCALVSTARDGSSVACGGFEDGCSDEEDCPEGSTCSEGVCLVDPSDVPEEPETPAAGGAAGEVDPDGGSRSGDGGNPAAGEPPPDDDAGSHDNDDDDSGGCSVTAQRSDHGLALALFALGSIIAARRGRRCATRGPRCPRAPRA